MDVEVLALAGGIFVLRVIGNMLTTLRTVMLVRGQKIRSSILAIFESLVFAVAIGSVVSNLNNIAKLNIYLTDLGHFALVNQVMADYFQQPYPARAAVGVASLPKGAAVEMDAVMELGAE